MEKRSKDVSTESKKEELLEIRFLDPFRNRTRFVYIFRHLGFLLIGSLSLPKYRKSLNDKATQS